MIGYIEKNESFPFAATGKGRGQTGEFYVQQEISDSPEGAVDLTSLARGLHPLANGYGRNPGRKNGVPT
ncbi:MAG: hypothetical protein LBD67_04375, partial [Candidatus Accumulibacter sp.]|nr:hypothetical protein [Accumulibacter sp.]